jgi:hypothetical protein
VIALASLDSEVGDMCVKRCELDGDFDEGRGKPCLSDRDAMTESK